MRSARPLRRLVRGSVVLVVPLLAIAVIGEAVAAPADKRVIINFLITVVLVLSIQTFSGNSGILSFAHVAFMGVGAYVAALVAMSPSDKDLSVPDLPGWLYGLQLSFVPAVLVAAAVTAAVAAVVGGALVRMRENAMAMATFGILVIFSVIFQSWNRFTGGAAGIYGIPGRVGMWSALAFVAVAIVVVRAYRESPVGLKLRATREDAVAAASLGADVARLRLSAWVLSAALMGLGGGVWAQYNLAFGPQQFSFTQTFTLLAMLVVGGLANVSGAVVGVFLVTLATEILRRVEDSTHVEGLTEIAIALLILLVLRARPLGVVGLRELDESWLRSRPRRWLERAAQVLRGRAPQPAHMPFTSRLVEINGATIEVWEGGEEEPTIVYQHPYVDPHGPAPAAGLGDALARAARTIVITPRGAGGSLPATAPRFLTMSQLVDDMEATRRALGIERWVVAGASSGGMAALVYALRYPEAVLALLVADSVPSWRFYEDVDSVYNPLHPEAWREEEARLALDGSDEATRRWVRTVVSLGLRNRTPLERLVETTRVVPERLRATREEVLGDPQWDVEDDLDSIRCQTLIICGRHDKLFPLRWSELMHERIPNSQLVVCEHSNHFPAEEEPERFQAAVAAFLDRVRAPAEAARA